MIQVSSSIHQIVCLQKFLGFKGSAEGIAPDPKKVPVTDLIMYVKSVASSEGLFFSEDTYAGLFDCCFSNHFYAERTPVHDAAFY